MKPILGFILPTLSPNSNSHSIGSAWRSSLCQGGRLPELSGARQRRWRAQPPIITAMSSRMRSRCAVALLDTALLPSPPKWLACIVKQPPEVC